MATRDVLERETSISRVVSEGAEEEVIVRGHRLSDLIGRISFAEMMFLLLRGDLATPAHARVLDALLVAPAEHGSAPPSMVSRCFALYGTNIQAAVAGGGLAFGDRMGGLGEQFAKLMSERLAALGATPAIDDEALGAEARATVAAERREGRRLPGFGIPLHAADPRAPLMLEIARREGTFGLYCRFAVALERALADSRGGKPIPMNLDGVGAAIVLDLGFPWQSTRMFLLTPRTVSMGAHYLEERRQDTAWHHIPSDRIAYED
jgi:citrate synthase